MVGMVALGNQCTTRNKISLVISAQFTLEMCEIDNEIKEQSNAAYLYTFAVRRRSIFVRLARHSLRRTRRHDAFCVP